MREVTTYSPHLSRRGTETVSDPDPNHDGPETGVRVLVREMGGSGLEQSGPCP